MNYQTLGHNIEWPDWSTHKVDNLMTYFIDCSLATGMDLGVALWQRELWLICTFFFLIWVWFYWINSESIHESFSNHSVPAASLSPHCKDTCPRRRRQVMGIICDVSYKGFLSSGRRFQAQKSSEVSETEIFLSVLTVEHFVLHRPVQYSSKVNVIWNGKYKQLLI